MESLSGEITQPTDVLLTTNTTYRNTLVEVDGQRFVNCVFIEATLVYSGGALPSFVGCKFDDVSLQFADAAADTLKFLSGLQAGGFGTAVSKIFDSIRQGTILKPPAPPAVAATEESAVV